MGDLSALAVRGVPTAELMMDALEVAVQEVVTAYDACTVTLARRLGVPMVTADEKLACAMFGSAGRDR